MALGTQTKEIGGTVFQATQLPARRSLRLFARLGKVAAPVIAHLTAVGQAKGAKKNLLSMDVGSLVPVLQALFEALPPAEAESLFEEVLSSTAIIEAGKSPIPLWPVVDSRLQGRTLDLFKVAAFALEVNYGDFLDAFRAATGASAAEPSTSPET